MARLHDDMLYDITVVFRDPNIPYMAQEVHVDCISYKIEDDYVFIHRNDEFKRVCYPRDVILAVYITAKSFA